MALQKQIQSIPFSEGLNQKASDKHLSPPNLDLCDNGKFSKTGQIQKRNGFTRLANATFNPTTDGTGTTASAEQCAFFQDERLLFDGNDAYARAESGTWVDKGRITGCTFEDQNIINTDGITNTPTAVARANNYRAEAWAEVEPETSPMVYQVYARVVDEATGVEVVPKARITPAAGISVTKAHTQNDDSNYLNPQVQAVAMGSYIFILFCDCQQSDPRVNITSVTDAGGGEIRVVTDAPHNYLYQDVVTFSGGTGGVANGDYIVNAVSSTISFNVTHSYSATGTGVTTVKQTYGSGRANGVHAVAINTGGGVASGITPTPLANFNSPAFYVNGVYPLFSASAMSPTSTVSLAGMASVFRYNTGPINDLVDTVAHYRMDYFREVGGVFIEYLETHLTNPTPGYRGRNTPINNASDPDAYFQASESLHASDTNDRRRTLSHICCASMDTKDRIMVAATFQEDMQGFSMATSGGTPGASQANPCVIRSVAHPFVTGDYVLVTAVVGMTELNGNTYQITKIDADTFSLDGINSTGFTAYTSGGTLFLQAPMVRTQTYDAAAVPTKIAISQAVGEPNSLPVALISGDFEPSGGDNCHFLFTGQATTLGEDLASTDDGQAAEHNLYKASIDFTDGSVKSNDILKCFTTLASEMFTYNGKVYFAATYAITPAAGLFAGAAVTFVYANFGSSVNVISDTDGNMIASGGTGVGGNCAATDWLSNRASSQTLFWNAARVSNFSTDKFCFGSSRFGDTSQNGNSRQVSRALFNPSYAEINLQPERNLPWVSGAGSLLLAGGLLWEYCGDSMKESGFMTYPQGKDGVTHSTTGGVIGNASTPESYTYRITYEWTSANGAVQRSYPSDPINVTTTASTTTQKFTFPVYTLQWTQKSAANGLLDPRIVLYRTEITGSVFYRVKSIALDATSYIQNITDDDVGNVALVENEALYSTGAPGDTLGNIAPPCSTDIVMHKNRVFLAVVDGSIWYSKKLSPRTAAEFSEFQVKPIENYAGKISCLGAVRDYVIAITQDNAYFIAGDGPNSAGVGADFTPPTIFSRDSGANIGCARTNSPIGFIYHAKGGIYQVDPAMKLTWIGAPVEDTVDSYGLTRAAVNDSQGEIYFGLDNATQGILVYNYVFNTWAHWKPRYAAFGSNVTPKGMMVHNGTLNFAIPSGYLLEQNTGFQDIGSSSYDFSLMVTTPWLKSEQFLHMARFYNVLVSGTFKSNHTLNCTIYSNYDESVADAQNLVVTSSNSSPYIVRQHVANQKARAIKVTIGDTPTSGTLESYQLDGISIQFGVRAGTFKLGTTKTLT